jgi:hypothetical protein
MVRGLLARGSILLTGGMLCALVEAASPDVQDDVADRPPTGFFTKLALAHGYKAVKDIFQTDRYKPEEPSTTFKSDVEAIYLVFEILPRENPAHILGQWYLEKGDGRPADTLVYEEGVYLQTSQDSGFLELPRPKDGWIPGAYKVKIHLGERVTEASQLGTLRFKIIPAA